MRREIMLSTERYRVANGWQSILELRSNEEVIVWLTLHVLCYSGAIILGQCLDKATDKEALMVLATVWQSKRDDRDLANLCCAFEVYASMA